MPITLYDAFVPSCLQILSATRKLLEKAEAFCAEKGLADDAITGACLAEDMRPFAFQIRVLSNHSIGAIDAVRAGMLEPALEPDPASFAEQKAQLDDTIAKLKQVSAEEMESFVGKDMKLSVLARGIELNFTAEDFLLSFSQPNFYFHATTVYDILRHKGLQIGKFDFMGAMRLKIPA